MKLNPLQVAPILDKGIIFKLITAVRIVDERAEKMTLKLLHVTNRQIWIIMAAGENHLSQGVVADCLGVNRNVMVLEIDKLEKRGFLKRVRNTVNRREQMISLTPKGRKLLRELLRIHADAAREVLRPLSDADIKEIHRWTRAIIEGDDSPRKTA